MNRILTSLKENFSTIGKIILIVLACGISGFVISYPLWKFAKIAPKIYTATTLFAIAIAVLFFLARFFSKLSARQIAKLVINLILIAGGTFGIIVLVLNECRLFALLLFIAVLIASFFANTFLYDQKKD